MDLSGLEAQAETGCDFSSHRGEGVWDTLHPQWKPGESCGIPLATYLSALLLVFLTGTALGGSIWWRAFFASWPRENCSFSTPINTHTHTITFLWAQLFTIYKVLPCLFSWSLKNIVRLWGKCYTFCRWEKWNSENVGHLPNSPKVRGNSGLKPTSLDREPFTFYHSEGIWSFF